MVLIIRFGIYFGCGVGGVFYGFVVRIGGWRWEVGFVGCGVWGNGGGSSSSSCCIWSDCILVGSYGDCNCG